jgi:lipopolysaccharide transport system permease protein
MPDLRDLAEHRDLLFLMARRDVAVRYKQSVAGVLWALLQPLLLAAVFAVFFGLLQKVDSEEGVPYPLFVVVGMVLWLFISNALQASSESTVESKELIRKVYFPRMLVPIAAIAPAAVDLAIGLGVAVVFAACYGFFPGLQTLAMPLVLLLAATTVVGAGLWLSALNVRYRDVHLAVPFLILLGLFLSPVIYPVDIVPDDLQSLYALNPMVGLFEAFRWSLLGTPFPGLIALISVGVSVLVLVTGAIYFQRAEQTFADVV